MGVKGQKLQNSFMSEFIHVHDYIYIYLLQRSARTGRGRESERARGNEAGRSCSLCQSFCVKIRLVTPAAFSTNGNSIPLPSGTDTLPKKSQFS